MKKVFILLGLVTFSFAEVLWLPEAQKRMNWYKAMDYCKSKNAILPSKKTYKEIWLKNNKASDIDGFDISVSYWTSDEVEDNARAAYPFYFGDGRESWYYKADKYGVRCIKK